MVGLSFAEESEAAVFLDHVNRRDSLLGKIQEPIPTKLLQVEAPSRGMTKSASMNSMDDKSEKSQKGSGFFGRTKSTKTKGKIDKSMISAPSDFVYVNLAEG